MTEQERINRYISLQDALITMGDFLFGGIYGHYMYHIKYTQLYDAFYHKVLEPNKVIRD